MKVRISNIDPDVFKAGEEELIFRGTHEEIMALTKLINEARKLLPS